jgi:hypothetical protein
MTDNEHLDKHSGMALQLVPSSCDGISFSTLSRRFPSTDLSASFAGLTPMRFRVME